MSLYLLFVQAAMWELLAVERIDLFACDTRGGVSVLDTGGTIVGRYGLGIVFILSGKTAHSQFPALWRVKPALNALVARWRLAFLGSRSQAECAIFP